MNSNVMLRFTSSARRSLTNALQEAELEYSTYIDTRHLLKGLLQLPESESSAAHLLRGLGITEEMLGANRVGEATGRNDGERVLSDGVKRTLERATGVARERSDKCIASVHLLAGIVDDAEIDQLLARCGVETARVRASLNSLVIWTDEP